MTPAAMLVIFCAAMAVVATWRLAHGERTDRVDLGSTVLVVGITLLSGVWAAVDASVLSPALRIALAVVGVAVAGVGVATVMRYWTEPSRPNATDE